MKLKNVNSNSDNIEARTLNNVDFFGGRLWKLGSKNKHHISFSIQDVVIAC
jgi:hypothetical protein